MPCLMRNGLNYTGGGSGGSETPVGSANIVELTQEEYDALDDGKLTDDTLYMIKDGIPSVLDNCVLLWENPNPSIAFDSQDIILASDDYDILEIFFALSNASTSAISDRLIKNTDSFLSSHSYTGNDILLLRRNVNKGNNPKILNFGDSHFIRSTTNPSNVVDNTKNIPVKIYGYKISGKYPSSVDQTSAQNNIFSYEETRIGTWVDGKPLYRKMVIIQDPQNPAAGSSVTKIPVNIEDIEFGYVNIGSTFYVGKSEQNSIASLAHDIKNFFAQYYVPDKEIWLRGFAETNIVIVCLEYTKTINSTGG